MTETAAKQLLRELGQLNRKSVFDEKAILEASEENALYLTVTLTPSDGLFAGTSVPFEFTFNDDYPASPPAVTCKAVVYHSNISEDGNVCFNMLSEPDPSYRLEHYVNGLLWLLNNQNFSSQLNGCVTSEAALFKVNFRLGCLGYYIGGLSCTKIMVNEPSQTERRKMVHEIFTFLQARPGEMTTSELSSFLGARDQGHLDFVKDQLPVVSKALTSQNSKDITFHWSKSLCTHVAMRAKKAGVSPSMVVKEMVVNVGGQPTLVLTLGSEGLDLQKLGESLGKSVELPKAGDLKRAGVTNVWELSVCDWKGPVILDAALKSHTGGKVLASAGYARLLVGLPAETLLSFMDNLQAHVVQVPRVPLPEVSEVAEVVVPVAPTAAEVVVVVAEKEVAERENSAKKDAAGGKKAVAAAAPLGVDSAIMARVPSDDGAVKVALESK